MIAMALASALLAAATATATDAAKAPTVWPARDVPWTDAPAVKGAKVALLWGDPKKEANGTFKKFPPGTEIPPHTHTHEQRTVVVAGTLRLRVADAPARDLTPGSFALVPGGVVHAATCAPESECIVYEELPGPADFIPAKAEEKK